MTVAVVGVPGHDAGRADDLAVDRRVGRRGDLDDDVHAVRDDFSYLGDYILFAVVDHVRGAGRRRELSLFRAADRGDDAGLGPAGQLDGGVADRARAALDQYGAPGQRAEVEPFRQSLADGQAAVRGQERDTESGTHVERGRAEPDDLPGRHGGVLGGGTPRPLPGGLPDPHPFADQLRVDPGADLLDHASAVLAGHLPAVRRCGAGTVALAGLPVGRIHTGDGHPDQYLARLRLGDRPVDHLQHRLIAGAGVDDRFHYASSPAVAGCTIHLWLGAR